MFSRYKDYIPLARYENGAYRNGTGRLHDPNWRRRAPVLAFYALSLGINLFFIYNALTAWPAALDNYQSL